MSDLRREIRQALRRMRRSPGFAVVVIVTMALGIGATAAVFSVVDGVLLRPLPYEEPGRLVMVWGSETGQRTGTWWASYPDFRDFEEQSVTLAELAAWSNGNATLTGGGEPIEVDLTRVTHDLFPLLGVTPRLGRGFLPEEDAAGGAPVAMLSNGFWRDRFGADPAVVGRSIALDGRPHTVIGILPHDFNEGEVYVPLVPEHAADQRGAHRIVPIGRLAPGLELRAAEAEIRAIAARLAAEYPETNTNRSAWLQPLHEAAVGDVETTLWTAFGMVGLVLLIASANVANLFLTRGEEQGREVALRSALGGRRRRILRQVGMEGLVLTGLGGIAGVAVAFGGLELVSGLAPAGIPRLEEAELSLRVLAFAALVTAASGLVFALLPGLRAFRVDLAARLKEGGRSTLRRSGGWLPQAVVVGEVALAVVAVVAAGLLVNSFVRLQGADAGFAARNVLVVPLSLPRGEYWDTSDPEEDGSRTVAFYREAERRLETLPGVTSVAAAYQHPLSAGWESSFWLPGVLEPPRGERPEARIRPVTPGYFRTAGIDLLEGRDFTERDDLAAPGVVIVNESFARTFFPAGDAIGHRVARGAWWKGQPEEFEIIGVVADVRMDGLSEAVPTALYFSHPQFPFSDMNLLVAATGDPGALVPAIRERIWSIDPDLPVQDVETLGDIRHGSVAAERFRTILVGVFGGLALLLSAIGIYGVLSYAVARRTHEMGLRAALGARAGDVVRLVVGQGMSLAGLGLAIGVLVALQLTGMLSSLLYGVSATDPATFGLGLLALAGVALAACLVPALRATRVDPLVALRAE